VRADSCHRAQREVIHVALIAALATMFCRAPAVASSGGIIGFSGKQSAAFTCNQCHAGGTAPVVEFEGPAQLAPDTTGTFVFRVRSQAPQRQTAAGFNVAADGGVLAIAAGQQGQFLFEEVTHTDPKSNVDGVAEWEFTWRAPTETGTYTLFGAGNSVDQDSSSLGDRAAATTYAVFVAALPTPTPTPRLVPCVGDCNGDGAVTIEDLLLGVSIALEQEPVESCEAFDVSGDGTVAVNELIAGVIALLNACLP
jgi:hypothetical protein